LKDEKPYIEIKVSGTIAGKEIMPDTTDINETISVIRDLENLLYPSKEEKNNRNPISYKIEEGSAKHIFYTGLLAIAQFNGIIEQVVKEGSIEFLDDRRAEIIERYQKNALEKGVEYSLLISTNPNAILKINSQTNYYKHKPRYIETELYLYGEINTEGGVGNPNIHIKTKEYGNLTVSATKEQLSGGENRMYKVYGLRVIAKQSVLERKKLEDITLLDYIKYNPHYNANELDDLISKTGNAWSDITDIDKWINEIRG